MSDEIVVSSFCNLGNCVARRTRPDGKYELFDTKTGLATSSPFTAAEWGRFVEGVKAGHYDFEAVS